MSTREERAEDWRQWPDREDRDCIGCRLGIPHDHDDQHWEDETWTPCDGCPFCKDCPTCPAKGGE